MLSLLVVWENGSSPIPPIVAEGREGNGDADDNLRLFPLSPIVADGKKRDAEKMMARTTVIQQMETAAETMLVKRVVLSSPVVAEGGETINLAATATATVIHWRSKG